MQAFIPEHIEAAIRKRRYDGHWAALADLPQFFRTEPLTARHAAEPVAAPTGPVSVAVFNIERGQQLEPTAVFMANHPQIRKADIIIANELDDGMARSGNVPVAQVLADRLSMNGVFALEFLELADIASPGRTVIPGLSGSVNHKGFHGNAIFSRFPILRSRAVRLPIYYDWFLDRQQRLGTRVAILAELDCHGRRLGVINVHFENVSSPELRAESFWLVHQAAGAFFEPGTPWVLGGDLNTNSVNGLMPDAFRPLYDPDEQARRIRELRRWEPVFALAESLGYNVGGCNRMEKVTRRRHAPGAPDIDLNLDWLFVRGSAVCPRHPAMLETIFRAESLDGGSPNWAPYEGLELSDHNAICCELHWADPGAADTVDADNTDATADGDSAPGSNNDAGVSRAAGDPAGSGPASAV